VGQVKGGKKKTPHANSKGGTGGKEGLRIRLIPHFGETEAEEGREKEGGGPGGGVVGGVHPVAVEKVPA